MIAAAWAPVGGSRLAAALRRSRTSVAGATIILGLAVVAVAAPALAPNDPDLPHPEQRLEAPSRSFPLGTDDLGRCTLSRLLVGARTSLGAPTLAVVMIILLGTLVGSVAGFSGGVIDTVLMRTVDVLLAFPPLIPAVAIVGVLGPGLDHLLLAVVSVWWTAYARVVRGLVMAEREKDYVLAARALGVSRIRILVRHILPNVMAPVLVLASTDTGSIILTMTALGFLGLGVQPPAAEWGSMLSDASAYLLSAPSLAVYPGIAISTAVLGFNLLGEGVRDVLDPRIGG